MTESAIDWEDFLQTNQAWIRTVIAARGARSADEVNEIFQNVALAVLRQQAPIREPAKVFPWLYTLAVNQTRLYCRTQARYRKRVEGYRDENPDGGISSEPEPLQWLLHEERRRRVHEALGRLEPDSCEILLLKYFHNWNYKEIAEKLGSTVSAVQSKLHRARAALKKEIRL